MTDTKISMKRLADLYDANCREVGGPFWHELSDTERTRLTYMAQAASRHQEPVNEPGEAVFIGGETMALVERLKASAAHCDMIGAPYVASACREAATALRAASIPKVEPGVKVKPLEWSSEPPYSVARVSSLRLLYSTEAVWDEGVFQHVELRGGFAFGDFPSVEAAKAAAQADYEQRIGCALSPSTSEGEPVAWVTADILAAMKRGERAVPGWKRSADFCIPLYAAPQPTPVVKVPNEKWADREPIYEAAIAAYEANTPPTSRYSAIAMTKAVDAAIGALTASLQKQESGE